MLDVASSSIRTGALSNAALAIDLAPDYNEQSKIQGFKTVFSIIGMVLPSILMYFFMP